MSRFCVGSREFEADAFVFDKDGLMFESQRFWQELASERIRRLCPLTDMNFCRRWAQCFGVTLDSEDNVLYTDPKGILAIAAPMEEIAATAVLLVQERQCIWDEARTLARAAFAEADEKFVLKQALKPRPGFPGILQRLREHNIPYCVATSDTYKRVMESLELFDDPAALSFCVTALDVEHGKPEPDMLFEAAKRFQLDCARLVMVGDSYVDVEMARRAHAIGIGVPETEEMRQSMMATGAIIADDLDQIKILEG